MKSEKIMRIRLVKIWDILSQETDDENPMGTTELLSKLEEIGIKCDRRTLYDDINALNSCGYEILCKRAISNEYYVKKRDFSIAELRIMMDAVQAASFITEQKSKYLIDRISFLAGSRRGETLVDNLIFYNNTKTDNDEIYQNIEKINEAIQKKKMVQFKYFDYDEKHKKVFRRGGDFYEINPYGLVMDNNNYYFLGYVVRHKNMIHYRVDRMSDLRISSNDIEEIQRFEEFDIKNHKKQLFGMFGGEDSCVKIRFHKSLLDTVFDVFGVDAKIYQINDDTYETTGRVQLSPQFYGWCCSFGDKLKVVEPLSVVEGLKEYITEVANSYN